MSDPVKGQGADLARPDRRRALLGTALQVLGVLEGRVGSGTRRALHTAESLPVRAGQRAKIRRDSGAGQFEAGRSPLL